LCEFCEYEAIFGEPPRALTRHYEVKDRKLRLQEAERRRLLEKAKAKSRKAKKAANVVKTAAMNGGNMQQQQQQPGESGGDFQHPPDVQLPFGDLDWTTFKDVDHHHHQICSAQIDDADSDAVDMDSDGGPPDLFQEYAHPVVPAQAHTDPLG
jgi:hypothetical protein